MPLIPSISLRAFKGRSKYFAHHGIDVKWKDDGHFYYTQQGMSEERLIKSSLKKIPGGPASDMFGAMLVLTKRLGMPFLFQIKDETSIFNGSICEVKYSPGWNPNGSHSSARIALTYQKQLVQDFRPWDFFSRVELSTAKTPELKEQSVIRDPFGVTYDIGDIVLFENKPAVVEEWRPLDQILVINFGANRRRVTRYNDGNHRHPVNLSKMDLKQIGRDLMLKKLKRK